MGAENILCYVMRNFVGTGEQRIKDVRPHTGATAEVFAIVRIVKHDIVDVQAAFRC